MNKVAIIVDGGFYRGRVAHFGETPEAAANTLYRYCQKHLYGDKEESSLYRVMYYDCPPSTRKVFHPLLRKVVDLKKEPMYRWMTGFLNELRKKRKFAVELASLADEQAMYQLKPTALKAIINGDKVASDLTTDDFFLSIRQKGVDSRIGIDIVALALKKQVDKIILIAGNSDFVTAAKFARREGIDFVLDSMGANIKAELSEHIDGLKYFRITPGKEFLPHRSTQEGRSPYESRTPYEPRVPWNAD